jgi:hypothetical protein
MTKSHKVIFDAGRDIIFLQKISGSREPSESFACKIAVIRSLKY